MQLKQQLSLQRHSYYTLLPAQSLKKEVRFLPVGYSIIAPFCTVPNVDLCPPCSLHPLLVNCVASEFFQVTDTLDLREEGDIQTKQHRSQEFFEVCSKASGKLPEG